MKSRENTKICFISGVISRSGGTERVGTIIANALSNRGYDVYILSCWNHGTPYFQVEKNVHVNYLLDPEREGKLYRTYVYPILKLHNFLKKNEIDIAVDIDTELAIYTSYAIQWTKCKQISWEHFNYWTMQKLRGNRRFRAKRLIKRFAAKLVVLTEQDRQKHIAEYQLDENFVVTMPNPCLSETESVYNFANNTFLLVGRLAPEKNILALLDAWYIIHKECADWKLVIVGKGELEQEIKEQASRLKLQNIKFVGHSDCVERYYKSASCFVLSSDYEGFPMVILEAQSYGLPVISFDCKTGPRDLVEDGVNGFLVEDGNVQQLAMKMLDFTRDAGRGIRMSAEAAKGVQKFNLEAVITKWIQLINDVLER